MHIYETQFIHNSEQICLFTIILFKYTDVNDQHLNKM